MNPTVKITADNARAIVDKVIDVSDHGAHLGKELSDLLRRIPAQLAYLEQELDTIRETLYRVRMANRRTIRSIRAMCVVDYDD